jgi:hypothetical protein
MKFINLVLAIFLTTPVFSQTVESTDIEVKLYLPAHLKNEIKPTDKLEIYFFPGDPAIKIPSKVVATKVKDNLYSFKLPQVRFMLIGFSIGVYRYRMSCINNKNGTAQDDYYFDIHLEKSNLDFKKNVLVRPCPRGDGEED